MVVRWIILVTLTVVQLAYGQSKEVNHEQKNVPQMCPCLPRNLCPRIFGASPEDSKYLGEILKCNEYDYVRCCGVSSSIVVGQPMLSTEATQLITTTTEIPKPVVPITTLITDTTMSTILKNKDDTSTTLVDLITSTNKSAPSVDSTTTTTLPEQLSENIVVTKSESTTLTLTSTTIASVPEVDSTTLSKNILVTESASTSMTPTTTSVPETDSSVDLTTLSKNILATDSTTLTLSTKTFTSTTIASLSESTTKSNFVASSANAPESTSKDTKLKMLSILTNAESTKNNSVLIITTTTIPESSTNSQNNDNNLTSNTTTTNVKSTLDYPSTTTHSTTVDEKLLESETSNIVLVTPNSRPRLVNNVTMIYPSEMSGIPKTLPLDMPPNSNEMKMYDSETNANLFLIFPRNETEASPTTTSSTTLETSTENLTTTSKPTKMKYEKKKRRRFMPRKRNRNNADSQTTTTTPTPNRNTRNRFAAASKIQRKVVPFQMPQNSTQLNETMEASTNRTRSRLFNSTNRLHFLRKSQLTPSLESEAVNAVAAPALNTDENDGSINTQLPNTIDKTHRFMIEKVRLALKGGTAAASTTHETRVRQQFKVPRTLMGIQTTNRVAEIEKMIVNEMMNVLSDLKNETIDITPKPYRGNVRFRNSDLKMIITEPSPDILKSVMNKLIARTRTRSTTTTTEPSTEATKNHTVADLRNLRLVSPKRRLRLNLKRSNDTTTTKVPTSTTTTETILSTTTIPPPLNEPETTTLLNNEPDITLLPETVDNSLTLSSDVSALSSAEATTATTTTTAEVPTAKRLLTAEQIADASTLINSIIFRQSRSNQQATGNFQPILADSSTLYRQNDLSHLPIIGPIPKSLSFGDDARINYNLPHKSTNFNVGF